MKRFLLFTILLCFSITTFAQAEWTGLGDGQSWNDPYNWFDEEEPQNGDDVYIDGGQVVYYGEPFAYASLTLEGGANLFIANDIFLMGDFYVDEISTLTVSLEHLNSYAKVISDGYVDFYGDIDLSFNTYVPQIGNSYKVVEGIIGDCDSTTDVVPDSQTSGFEVSLDVECQSDGILHTVTDINYTTAKYWTGAGGDNFWANAANWNNNQLPNASSVVIINLNSGTYLATSGLANISVNSILIGDGNTLSLSGGNLGVFSVIHINDTGTLVWNGGEISKTNPTGISTIINYGSVNLNTSTPKTILNGFEIWNYGNIEHNQGDLNINTGIISNFNSSKYNINGDNINIGYNSGVQHSLRNYGNSSIKKTAGSGISLINLTDFLNYSTVASNQGILTISDNYNSANYGTLAGNGSIALPIGLIEGGKIAPGNSTGILTFVKNLNTSANADYNIEINGPNPGTEYDQIIVEDDAILNGTINVTLGYLPADDAIFEVLTAGNIVHCNFPTQVTANYNGTDFTFDVLCQNNILYLHGPDAILSIADFDASELVIYPNPVNNILTIRLSRQVAGKWMLHNIIGQEVLKGGLTGLETNINTTSLESGFYALQIKDNRNNTVKVKKIIVTN